MPKKQGAKLEELHLRRGTKDALEAKNPVLPRGMPVAEIDDANKVARLKIGDGTSCWNDLKYISEFTLEQHTTLIEIIETYLDLGGFGSGSGGSGGGGAGQVGEIVAFFGNDAPPGTLLCDGSLMLVLDYKELFEYVMLSYPSVDDCPYFVVAPNGYSYIQLPDLRGKVLSGITSAEPLGTRLPIALMWDPSDLESTAISFCIRYESSTSTGGPSTPSTSLELPPNDGQVYGMMNGQWVPHVVTVDSIP